MTALELEPDRRGYAPEGAASDGSLDDVVGGLESIGLSEVQARVELQTRVDRKYIVERSLFEQLVEDLHPELRCLTIDGRTGARYRSTYFDTPELVFFYQHLQGRRRRFKVRTRSYLDSGTTLLEVKAKGLRSATVKERVPWSNDVPDRLGPCGDGFVAEVTGTERYRGALGPSVETLYRRTTLVDEVSPSRITCDTDLRFRRGADEVGGLWGEVLIETKSAAGRCATDRWLLDHGVRPTSMSKYCLGVALLYPNVRANPWHPVLRRHFGWTRRRSAGAERSGAASAARGAGGT